MTRRIFAIALIIIGSFLEIWYYSYRFTSDGIPTWLAVIIGIALTLLLTVAVYLYQRRHKWAIWIIIPVAFYSIFATSAGQAFSLGEVLRAEAKVEAKSQYVIDEITDIEKQIEWIDKEVSRLSSEIDATTNSLEDRYEWKNTLAKAEDQQRQLMTDRSVLSKRLTELRSTAQEHESIEVRSRNIYTFYGGMLGWSEEWLQFGLQTILSAFIAIMAPIGIMTYPKTTTEEPKIVSPKPERLSSGTVESWVRINWIGIRSGNSKHILSIEKYIEFLYNRGEKFDRTEYNKILNIAQRQEVIASDGRVIEKDEKKAVNMIINVDK